MKTFCILLFAIILGVTSCKKGTLDNPIILEGMELSELTLSQFPYQSINKVFFEDSLGEVIDGLIYRDTLKDQYHNHEDAANIRYRYRKQSQAIVLIFPSIDVRFTLIFENMYWEPSIEEQIDQLQISIYGLNNGESYGVLRMVTDRKNASDEIIESWYENLAIQIGEFPLGSKTYYSVLQGAISPDNPIHFYYNSAFGILSFIDHEGKRWDYSTN